MKLLTKDLEEKLKEYPLGSQDGDAEMFGYCHLGDDELAEFGTVMLSELESIRLPMGMTIERDLYIPKEIDLMQALIRDGYQVPDYIKKEGYYLDFKYETDKNKLENASILLYVEKK